MQHKKKVTRKVILNRILFSYCQLLFYEIIDATNHLCMHNKIDIDYMLQNNR